MPMSGSSEGGKDRGILQKWKNCTIHEHTCNVGNILQDRELYVRII